MEVIEVSSPAEHETFVDHEMNLPTADVEIDSDFGGQRFVRHQENNAKWLPGPYPGYEIWRVSSGHQAGSRTASAWSE